WAPSAPTRPPSSSSPSADASFPVSGLPAFVEGDPIAEAADVAAEALPQANAKPPSVAPPADDLPQPIACAADVSPVPARAAPRSSPAAAPPADGGPAVAAAMTDSVRASLDDDWDFDLPAQPKARTARVDTPAPMGALAEVNSSGTAPPAAPSKSS